MAQLFTLLPLVPLARAVQGNDFFIGYWDGKCADEINLGTLVRRITILVHNSQKLSTAAEPTRTISARVITSKSIVTLTARIW